MEWWKGGATPGEGRQVLEERGCAQARKCEAVE